MKVCMSVRAPRTARGGGQSQLTGSERCFAEAAARNTSYRELLRYYEKCTNFFGSL